MMDELIVNEDLNNNTMVHAIELARDFSKDNGLKLKWWEFKTSKENQYNEDIKIELVDKNNFTWCIIEEKNNVSKTSQHTTSHHKDFVDMKLQLYDYIITQPLGKIVQAADIMMMDDIIEVIWFELRRNLYHDMKNDPNISDDDMWKWLQLCNHIG